MESEVWLTLEEAADRYNALVFGEHRPGTRHLLEAARDQGDLLARRRAPHWVPEFRPSDIDNFVETVLAKMFGKSFLNFGRVV